MESRTLHPTTQPIDRIELNVGGKLFETTVSTIFTGGCGEDSLIAALSARAARLNQPVFIDRDPELFAALLSLLRSDRLPSKARLFSKQDLVEEAQFYGIEPRLRAAMSPPPLLGYDATLVDTLIPAADAFPTAISAGIDDGSLWIAHGGQISSYDWSLRHVSSLRTHLDDITSMCRAGPEITAVGSSSSPGFHLYSISTGRHVESVHWTDASDPRVNKAWVTAIATGGRDPVLYAAFECPHRENCIMAVDKETMKPTTLIGRQSGGAAKTAAAGKVAHVGELGMVFASSVAAGAFGYSGYVRLWDPRSGAVVWVVCEPGGGGRRFGDALADADVDIEGMKIYKVCWNSGDVAAADMRQLRSDEPWTYLEDPSAAQGPRQAGAGEGSVVHCYSGQVFVGKQEGLEVWSELAGGEGTYRRNYVDKEEEAKRGMVRKMRGGGERLFVCREGMEGVEVWESSNFSGAVSLYHFYNKFM